jgi:hypothetical protein
MGGYPGLGVEFSDVGSGARAATSGGAAGGLIASPLVGAGILGLTQLVGGLFGAAAERERQKREMRLKAAEGQYASTRDSANTQLQGEHNAFGQMMAAYRDALR